MHRFSHCHCSTYVENTIQQKIIVFYKQDYQHFRCREIGLKPLALITQDNICAVLKYHCKSARKYTGSVSSNSYLFVATYEEYHKCSCINLSQNYTFKGGYLLFIILFYQKGNPKKDLSQVVPLQGWPKIRCLPCNNLTKSVRFLCREAKGAIKHNMAPTENTNLSM